MITDIDESSVIGINQYEEKKLNFDGKNPLLFFFTLYLLIINLILKYLQM